jgi:hypothetical protein
MSSIAATAIERTSVQVRGPVHFTLACLHAFHLQSVGKRIGKDTFIDTFIELASLS